jgi:hypothetical protein
MSIFNNGVMRRLSGQIAQDVQRYIGTYFMGPGRESDERSRAFLSDAHRALRVSSGSAAKLRTEARQ